MQRSAFSYAVMLRHPFATLPMLLVLIGASLPAPAQEPVQNVVVTATRDPVDKSYRKMVRGMERFARQQAALAPGATLRFRLLPRLPGTRMDGIVLKVVGDTVTLPVAIAPDNSFTLERDERAWREDAALLANRRTTSMTWRAEVRSPGVPDGQRRLGDLRLECLVGTEAGLVSNNAHLFAWLAEMLTDPDKVCGTPDGNYLFFTERPVFAVTLRAGGRGAQLPPRFLYAGGSQAPADLPYCDCQVLLERSYYAPLWDRSWPDDTLLSFEYMDEPAPPNAPSAPGVEPGQDRAQVRAILGAGTEVAFGNGMQAWLYPPVQRKLAPQQLQYLVLFGADGRVLKSRAWMP